MMQLKDWEELPQYMQNESVRVYYDILTERAVSLRCKRVFDVVVSVIMLVVVSPVLLILAVWIKLDSPGPVFFRQERVTQYGRIFRIYKLRTMVSHAEKIGSQVTVRNDERITRVGNKIRKARLDELPQLINVLTGDMSFVGTRPEVKKYVDGYTEEMYATLLLPAGITSEASIRYKDEDVLLTGTDDVDKIYMEQVLPEKMKYNLEAVKRFHFTGDIVTLIRTVVVLVKQG